MKCPCKGCNRPQKKLYCHSHCDEYKQWCKQEEEKKKAERKNNQYLQSEDGKRIIWRAMRWKGK